MKTKEFQKLLQLSYELNDWEEVRKILSQEKEQGETMYREMTLEFLSNETKRKED